MSVEAKPLGEQEVENARLKKLLAGSTLGIEVPREVPREVLRKMW